jgi:uncharacterized protein YacL
MSKLTARILSKICLFLVAIGFFMPFARKMNVFGLINDLSKAASWLDIDIGSYKFLIYLIFISSVIGVLIGVLLIYFLLAGKSLSLDLYTVLIANGSFLILLIRLNNLAKEVMGSFGSSSSEIKNFISNNLEFGAYLIIIGLILSFIFMLIALLPPYDLLFNISLWLIVIGCSTGGIFIGFYTIGGGDASTSRADILSIIGMIIGLIIGLIINFTVCKAIKWYKNSIKHNKAVTVHTPANRVP